MAKKIQKNTPRKMGKNLYGLGFSPLSIGNKDHSFPEELMSHKETGLFAIMGEDGYMVSSEYLGRTKAHIEQFAQKMIQDNLLGTIYKMTLDDNLVRTVRSSENMMVNYIVIPREKEPITGLRFDIGLDYFEKETSATIMNPSDIRVEIEYSVVRGDTAKTFKVNEDITRINSTAFKVSYDGYPAKQAEDKYYLKINSFKVITPEGFNFNTHTIAVHDILFAIMGGGTTW